MQSPNVYVYLVYRVSISLPLHCTDLVGKVGKGTGKRIDVYRTPYGSDNLHIDVWECNSNRDALELESVILDILEMRGWLRYHAPKNNRKGKRAEVISFPLHGKTQAKMCNEYSDNMNWIRTLINHYSAQQNAKNVSPAWNRTREVITNVKGKIADSLMQRENLSLFSLLGQSSPSKNLSLFFNGSISLSYDNDTVLIMINEKKERKCSLM